MLISILSIIYLVYFLLIILTFTDAQNISAEVSLPIRTILYSVERNIWNIPFNSSIVQETGCLIGAQKCDFPRNIPTEEDLIPSPQSPSSNDPEYQRLAEFSEKLVPSTTFREAFSHPDLLLSVNKTDLPLKLLSIHNSNSKLKIQSLYQCVTGIGFIRTSLDFQNNTQQFLTFIKSSDKSKIKELNPCTMFATPVIKKFFKLWKVYSNTLDADLVHSDHGDNLIFKPKHSKNGELIFSAMGTLEYFLQHYGGNKGSCFRLIRGSPCRGALAAACLVSSSFFLGDIIGKNKSFTPAQFTRGYMLASLGRHLLHADSTSVGIEKTTLWGVKLVDFIALQSAYLQLYTQSFGKLYSQQLNKYIPMTFDPEISTTFVKPEWKSFAQQLEPVYQTLRNWMHTEANALIDFGPYLPLVSFPEARDFIAKTKKRRILMDVGANGFFSSPKYLLDSYLPFLPFTDMIMVEPEPHFSATVPHVYTTQYNITFHQIYAEVGTNSSTDILQLIPRWVTPDDYFVLKFDVDTNGNAQGKTMEWGFLFEITQRPEVAKLIDEIYIEIHFYYPSQNWFHYHSQWEALDAIRYLRNQGVIVHAWP